MGLKLYVRRFGVAGTFDVVDLTTNLYLRTFTVSGGTRPMSIPSQGRVYINTATSFTVIDAQTDTALTAFTYPSGGSYSTLAALSPDASVLYVLFKATGDAGTGFNSVRAISTADGSLLGRMRYDTAAHAYQDIAISADGAYIYVGENGNTNGGTTGFYTRFTVAALASGGAGALMGNYWATKSAPLAGDAFLGGDSTSGGTSVYRSGPSLFNYGIAGSGSLRGLMSGLYLPVSGRAYVVPVVGGAYRLDPAATSGGGVLASNLTLADAGVWAALPDESRVFLSRSSTAAVSVLDPVTLAVLATITMPGNTGGMSIATDTPGGGSGGGGGWGVIHGGGDGPPAFSAIARNCDGWGTVARNCGGFAEVKKNC